MVVFNDFFNYCIQNTIKLKANLSCHKSKRSPQRSGIATPRSRSGSPIFFSNGDRDRDRDLNFGDRGHALLHSNKRFRLAVKH